MTVKRTPRSHILRALVLFLAVSAFLIASCAGQELNSRRDVPAAKAGDKGSVAVEPDPANPVFLPAVAYDSGGTDVLQTNGGIFQNLVTADLTGNGKLDVVVSNLAGPNQTGKGVLGVLLGKGDGTFKPVVTFASGGYGASAVAVADVNGDGVPDVVVANTCVSSSNCANGTVSVLLGKGNGTFKSPVTYSSGGQAAVSIAVADVNGDGKLDLLVANQTGESNGDGSIAVLLGNGNGTFQPAVTYDAGDSVTSSLAVADLNGDGKPDVVLANSGRGTVTVLLANGGGTFQQAVVYGSGGEIPVSVAVADLNGDGNPDIIVANWYSGTLGVLLSKGNGTFQTAVTYSSGGASPDSVVVADVNGDGKPDLIAANCGSSQNGYGCGETDGVVSVLPGYGDGTFQPAVTFDSGAFNDISVAVADVNEDGKPDVLVGNQSGGSNGDGSVGVLLNNGQFTPAAIMLVSSPNPSFVGQAVTFRASVTSSAGTPPDGETITFHKGTAVLGTGVLSGGVASLLSPALLNGVYSVTASYGGDGNFGANVSPVLRQVVNTTNKSATLVTLVSSLNPSIYGQAVTFKATVASSGSLAPTGTVNFTWDNSIGSVTLNNSGIAILTRSNLYADSYPLTAAYSGDANNASNISGAVYQVIEQATSSAILSSSQSSSTHGEAVTFTATITSPTVVPSGPVTFLAGKTVLGTAQLSNGKAQFTTSSLPVGSTKVTATYYGDSNIAASSASVTETVQ
ncbi:MAG: FG-GAP-like repeat-containing protein [Candidatus Sulfotelmatobacter sp.]